MNSFMTAHAAFALLAGGFAAQLFCHVLWRETRALNPEHASVIRALGGAMLRTTLTAGSLVLAGGAEWAPTVAALAGFAVSRWVATRRIVRAPA